MSSWSPLPIRARPGIYLLPGNEAELRARCAFCWTRLLLNRVGHALTCPPSCPTKPWRRRKTRVIKRDLSSNSCGLSRTFLLRKACGQQVSVSRICVHVPRAALTRRPRCSVPILFYTKYIYDVIITLLHCVIGKRSCLVRIFSIGFPAERDFSAQVEGS